MTVLLGPLTAAMMGDAYGAGWEFLPTACIGESNNGTTYYQHTMEPRMPAGCYSDDEQRLLANADVLINSLEHHLRWWDAPQAYDGALKGAMMVNPRGASDRMKDAYRLALQKGISLSTALGDNNKTDGAGGAMGASVFGMLPLLEDARAAARAQASFSHAHGGVLAAEMVATMAWYLLHTQIVRSHLREVMLKHFPTCVETLSEPAIKRVMNKGIPCVNAALTAIERATSLKDLLVQCVAIGGDTDTVATIAMGCAWCCEDLPNDLPATLWEGLEEGEYGKLYVQSMDERLMSLMMGLTGFPQGIKLREWPQAVL